MVKATKDDLHKVHSTLVRLIQDDLDFIEKFNASLDNWEGDPESKPPRIRLESALVNSIARFLNDNEITADPADTDDLQDLRDKLSKRSAASRSIIGKARSLEDGLH